MGSTALTAVAFGLCVWGCTVEATGVLVTLATGAAMPARITVDLSRQGGSVIGRQYAYTAGRLSDPTTFGIQLDDAESGSTVVVDVRLYDAMNVEIGCGIGSVIIVKHKVEPLSIGFSDCKELPDMLLRPADLSDLAVAPPADSGDLAMPDAEPDLLPDLSADQLPHQMPDLGPDLAMDMSMPDFAMPDMACARKCAAGVATVCCGGGGTQVTCGSGCDGMSLGCQVPTCMAPKDISNGAVVAGDSAGGPDNLSGSCGGVGASESVYSFTLTKYSMVQVSVASTGTPVVYTRSTCGMGIEVPAGGLCNKTAVGYACSPAQKNPSQFLCGLPPGTYYTAIDGSACGVGGAFSVSAQITPSSLDDCPGAGLLPGPYPQTVTGDTSMKMGSVSMAPMGTLACGDLGATAPEFVYYVPALKALPMGHLRARLTAAGNGWKPLVYLQQRCAGVASCSDGAGLANNLPAVDLVGPALGPYFIFVDGNAGSKGSFTLEVYWGP